MNCSICNCPESGQLQTTTGPIEGSGHQKYIQEANPKIELE